MWSWADTQRRKSYQDTINSDQLTSQMLVDVLMANRSEPFMSVVPAPN